MADDIRSPESDPEPMWEPERFGTGALGLFRWLLRDSARTGRAIALLAALAAIAIVLLWGAHSTKVGFPVALGATGSLLVGVPGTVFLIDRVRCAVQRRKARRQEPPASQEGSTRRASDQPGSGGDLHEGGDAGAQEEG
jgi:hypothetical protein